MEKKPALAADINDFGDFVFTEFSQSVIIIQKDRKEIDENAFFLRVIQVYWSSH